MHAIINRCLYIFYPIIRCGLYCRAVSVTDNSFTKQEKFYNFGGLCKVCNRAWFLLKSSRSDTGARTAVRFFSNLVPLEFCTSGIGILQALKKRGVCVKISNICCKFLSFLSF